MQDSRVAATRLCSEGPKRPGYLCQGQATSLKSESSISFAMGVKRELDDSEYSTPSPKKSSSRKSTADTPASAKWSEQEVILLVHKRNEGLSWE